MAPMSISGIVAIPHEILQYILTYCGPLDVSSFARTCRLGRNVVYSGDAYIWRQLLITGWDDPRRSLRYTLSALPEDIDWRRCLQNRVHAERMVTSKSPLELDNLRFVIETFMDVIDATSPIPWAAKYMESSSDGLTWLSLLLHRSSVLYQIVSGDTKLGQMIAQLKVYFSLSDDAFHDDPELHFGPLIGQKRRSQSRHFVYDLRNYTVNRSWGPLLPNGSPNWVHLYYLMNVVWANICDLPGFWSNVRPPIGLEAIRAFSAPAAFNSSDWAGIQGRWKRYVCFMDYRDLFAFNFSNVLRGPRDLAFFNDNPHFREATRLIELQLSLIPREELKHTKPEEIPSSPYEAFPPLFFNGKSRAAHGTDSSIEGVVSMDENGVVRYQFWEKTTMSEAPMQWSSQGIQIGKVGCAAGVVGVWTTRVHDAEDPVGPFWLWKMDDDLPPSELFDYN